MRARLLAVLLATLVVLFIGAAPALEASGTSPVGQDVVDAVANASSDDQIPVLIIAPGHADDVQAALPDTPMDAVPLVGGLAASLTPDQIQQLDESAVASEIDDIQIDDDVVGLGTVRSLPTDELSFTNFAIDLGGTVPVNGGAGVNVAVLDTGVTPHPDLAGTSGYRIVAFKDFVQGKKDPYDDAGHGTFVAGLIAGNGASSIPVSQGGRATRQYRGAAPQAGIVAVKVLNAQGAGRESDVLRGIAWVIRNRVRYNIEVLNISLGAPVVAPTEFDAMAYAVEAAWKAGITVVTAAGNEGDFGPGGILAPGNDPYVITVGAMDTHQTATPGKYTICTYSSIGPTLFDEFAKPDVVAPGNRNISLRVPGSYVDTTWPENRVAVPGAETDAGPAYYMLSGTSTSAPVVSGIVAAMLSADTTGTLTPDDIKLRLMATARPLRNTSDLQQGAGLVDAGAALHSSLIANGPTLSRDLGDGTTILDKDRYAEFGAYMWDKSNWTKFKWTKFKWTDVNWDKFKWTKFKWTDVDWTKFKWTGVDWQKFKWTTVDWTKFKWTTYDWLKFKWTILIEGQ